MPTQTQRDRVDGDLDIPTTAYVAPVVTTIAGTTVLPAVAAVSAVAGMTSVAAVSAIDGVVQTYISNRLTFFEELVIAITNGFAARTSASFNTDQEFAQRALALARAIAYERDKYGS